MPRECGRCGQHNSVSARYCNGCGFLLLAALPDGATLEDGRYEIRSLIRQGGMGCVYRATDCRLGRDIALKEMLDFCYPAPEDRAAAAERFEQEARLLAGLSHRSLPRVSDFFTESGRHYLAMDLVQGKDLEAYLHRHGAPGLPESQVCRWGAQMAEVLDYLHRQDPPIIYRDLKPSNVMVRPGPDGSLADGDVVLVDFGIARRVYTDLPSRTAVGTEGYAPLEQYQGRLDPRSDLYALGATLYHLLTGKVPTPFKFPPIRSLRSDVSEALQAVLARCLALEPEGRLASAALLRDSLRRLAGLSEPALPTAASPASAARGMDGWRPTPLLLPAALPLDAARAAAPRSAPTVREPAAALAGRTLSPAALAASTVMAKRAAPRLAPGPGEPRDFTRVGDPRALPPVISWTDGSSMALIPAGEFWMGAADSDPGAEDEEFPRRLVQVGSFYMDRFPVTNAQFDRFVRETGFVTTAERRRSPQRSWRNPAGRRPGEAPPEPHRRRVSTDGHPVVCVSWEDAREYCRWAGKRLPTEAEWEKAARGRDGRLYPWGSQWEADRCNSGQLGREELLGRMANIYAGRGTLPAGCFPAGNSPYGLMDMAGNVSEWVEDWFRAYPGSSHRSDSYGEQIKVVRGGSWCNVEPAALRCSRRRGERMDSEFPFCGFRCAADA